MRWLGIWIVLLVISGAGCGRPEIARRTAAFETAGAEIKLLSFPIGTAPAGEEESGWTDRRNAVLDLLADHGADVVGLQGASRNQVQDIRAGLPVYEAAGMGSSDWDPAWPICPVLFRKDRFRAMESGSFWFSNTPWVAGSVHWGQESPRACIWVRLTERQTGRGFIVYNVQMDRRTDWSREKSAELLVRQIARRGTDEPVIVIGDFIDEADSRAVRILRGEELTAGAEGVRLIDTWLPSGLGEAVDVSDSGQGVGTDMILTGPETEVVWAEIDRRMFGGQYPSDHFPVAALIRLP
jgi:endonuclease/exonuclease/phosphatase family metal-dependent hydrolase